MAQVPVERAAPGGLETTRGPQGRLVGLLWCDDLSLGVGQNLTFTKAWEG